jgi:hypothetical protein
MSVRRMFQSENEYDHQSKETKSRQYNKLRKLFPVSLERHALYCIVEKRKNGS